MEVCILLSPLLVKPGEERQRKRVLDTGGKGTEGGEIERENKASGSLTTYVSLSNQRPMGVSKRWKYCI